ncbi:hypothetical protein COLO4_37912 [Corchorus olitorius]|uniref:Uncharacterized protein n=1 Tax=Corchorus olitorius TaxID=93759 RepID=A0A1R3FY12_9ROSI|nr:hypothetical protein COLO4_37912 [Corchorus olitorius]
MEPTVLASVLQGAAREKLLTWTNPNSPRLKATNQMLTAWQALFLLSILLLHCNYYEMLLRLKMPVNFPGLQSLAMLGSFSTFSIALK